MSYLFCVLWIKFMKDIKYVKDRVNFLKLIQYKRKEKNNSDQSITSYLKS